MARDPIETRAHTATPLTDTNDSPTGSSFLEAIKDAFVERLTAFFAKNTINADRRTEAPTIRKYAAGFGVGEDPYTTFQTIVQEFSDVAERLPHIAVLAATGTEKALSVGRPLVATVQDPPRVTGTVTEPFALPGTAREVRTLTVLTASSTYTFIVDGEAVTVVTTTGTTATAAAAIATAVRVHETLSLLYDAVASNAVITLTHRDAGTAFVLVAATAATLSAALVTPAGVATADGVLAVRTTPNGRDAVTSRFTFQAGAFPTTAPVTAATAAGVASAISSQALHVLARSVVSGASNALELRCADPTPNEVEVIPAGTGDVAATLGLAVLGSAAVGWAITVNAAAGTATLTASAGTPFSGAAAGRYVTLAGWTESTNDGRFLVTAVGGGGSSLTFVNTDAVAETYTTGAAPTWFVGLRDDWTNVARPVKHRYVGPAADLTVDLEVYAEDPNARRELLDLVWSFIGFFAEESHFTWYGRSVFDETILDEWLQISLGRASGAAGDQDFPRAGDEKVRIYATRLTVPVVAIRYRDREVTVLTGPRTSQSWTLQPSDLTEDPTLPTPS